MFSESAPGSFELERRLPRLPDNLEVCTCHRRRARSDESMSYQPGVQLSLEDSLVLTCSQCMFGRRGTIGTGWERNVSCRLFAPTNSGSTHYVKLCSMCCFLACQHKGNNVNFGFQPAKNRLPCIVHPPPILHGYPKSISETKSKQSLKLSYCWLAPTQ